MITLKDIKPKEDGYYYIDKSVKIFGQMRFDEGNEERLVLDLSAGAQPEDILDKLNAYLGWLADCRSELIAFYKERFENNDGYFGGEMTPDWYETLDLYSGIVSIGKDGKFGADLSTGDNINEDHLLMIEIDGREITSMWHDG